MFFASSTKLTHPHYVPGLDLLRFAAAASVVMYHLTFWSWAFPAGQVALASKGVADFHEWPLVTSAGWIGVQIFFVISGFVIATSAASSTPSRFFISRFTRLAPGVWVCATITLIAWLMIDVGTPAAHMRAYVKSVAFVPMPMWIDSVYWTLGVEIAFYGLIWCLVAYNRFDRVKPIMCGIGLASSLFWLGYTFAALYPQSAAFSFFNHLQWSRLAQLSLLHHGVFFAIGVLLWIRLARERSNDQLGWLLLFFTGACLQIAAESDLKLEKTGIAVSPLLACSIWLISMCALYWVVKDNRRMQRMPPPGLQLLRALGLITYPLYLLHNVTGGALLGTFVGWGMSSGDGLLLTLATLLALSWWISAIPEPALQKVTRSTLDTIAARWRPASQL